MFVVEVPCPTLAPLKISRAKLGEVTVSVATMEDLRVPETPEMVTGYVPGMAEEVAANVRLELFPTIAGLGEKEALTPAGRPEMASCTLPVKLEFEERLT